MRLLILTTILLLVSGCNASDRNKLTKHEPNFLVPLETLREELTNPKYEWHGPTSIEDRIPVLHAARALAYRGDSSADILFDAVDDIEIEIISILDAISELGIPAHEFHDDIMNRNSRTLREWWAKNQDASLGKRNERRKQIGLPPARIGT